MKNLKSIFAVVGFALMTQFSIAGDVSVAKKPESVQIRTILNSIDFTNLVKSETKLNISFFINSQNEVIVVTTNNKELDGVIKSTLNYKKIAVNELEYNKVYTVPVHIK
ncbi:MAG: hypothetical protein IPK35_01760 [Saprospiraceae bacterium]|jgi:nitrate reductase NapAB chaperone NapD|nr:hypothetical protein [Saprospiraceae bacterium]